MFPKNILLIALLFCSSLAGAQLPPAPDEPEIVQEPIYDFPDLTPTWQSCKAEDELGRQKCLGESYREFMESNATWPAEIPDSIEQGNVYFECVVELDGSVSNIKILKSFHAAATKEAMRLIKQMPKFRPGKTRGKVVRSRLHFPIRFTKT
jgi:TonB family protein